MSQVTLVPKKTAQIEIDNPQSWRDLQNKVAQILNEAGVQASVEKVICTTRGRVSIDVWANDPAATPAQTYLIECKLWRARVPQSVVHSFRSVVGDSGANWGAIISAKGFQKGAYEAAKYTNVRLLSWSEFQDLFLDRWFSKYFGPQVLAHALPLIEYTEPINSRIFRKADRLSPKQRTEFMRLRDAYSHLGYFCVHFPTFPKEISLPLRKTYVSDATTSLPLSILDARSFCELMESIAKEVTEPLKQFDAVFGERA